VSEDSEPAEAPPASASPDDAPGEASAREPEWPREKIDWLGELRGLALMLLAVLAFHSLIAKPFYIPSISMMPNLLVGDRLVVSKYPYGWNWSSVSFHLLPRGSWRLFGRTPEYGDIVIVVPKNRKEDLIKRVVALPGDRIAVVNGQIILNGKPVPQSVEPPVQIPVDDQLTCPSGWGDQYCYTEFAQYRTRLPSGREVYELPTLRETLPNGATYRVIDHVDQELDHFAQVRVPAGHVFLMGDNRDHSADSRAPLAGNGLGGPVPLSNIGGRAEFVTFSLDGSQTWNPLTWWSALRKDRAWSTLRPRIDTPIGTTGKQ
jgi:signal peptidase I